MISSVVICDFVQSSVDVCHQCWESHERETYIHYVFSTCHWETVGSYKRTERDFRRLTSVPPTWLNSWCTICLARNSAYAFSICFCGCSSKNQILDRHYYSHALNYCRKRNKHLFPIQMRKSIQRLPHLHLQVFIKSHNSLNIHLSRWKENHWI